MIMMTLDMTTATRKRDEIVRTFKQFIGPTEAQPGCLGCRLLQDLGGEKRLLCMESWREESDLMRRICSAPFRRVLAVMELSSELPELRIQTVSESRGLEAIKLIRQAQSAPGGRQGNVHQGLNANQE